VCKSCRFAIAFQVMAVSYGMVICRITRTQLRPSNVSYTTKLTTTSFREHNQTINSASDCKRITLMCASLVLCFTFLWLPFHVGHLAKLSGIPLPEKQVSDCCQIHKITFYDINWFEIQVSFSHEMSPNVLQTMHNTRFNHCQFDDLRFL